MKTIKRWILDAFRLAGYTIVHNEIYFERQARSAGGKYGQAEQVRPLTAVTHRNFSTTGEKITPESVSAMRSDAAYADALTYFTSYPTRSLMSDHSRATLFALVRKMRPKIVAEIGTLFAGTTEVIARALWENHYGFVHTTDPFGAGHCPGIIGNWPLPLREVTKYHSLNSMDFFLAMESQRITLDLVLVDGNHDFEFASFDLQEAAKLLRPGGIIVMDNAEQTGPYQAARTFLANHPGWRELGEAVASFDVSKPFDETRASLPDTSFILLQAPNDFIVSGSPQSCGQVKVLTNAVTGISLDFVAQTTAGVLHYQAIFRAFGDSIREVVELKSVGSVRIDLTGREVKLSHDFKTPLKSDMQSRYASVDFRFEIDLAWEADPGAPPLVLARGPLPYETHRR